MGYSAKYAKKIRKPKKVSTFACYTKIFNQIKQMKSDFFIKRILFKALVSMIENTPGQDSLLWLNMIEEWSDLCEDIGQEKKLNKMMRKMKFVFIDREIS